MTRRRASSLLDLGVGDVDVAVLDDEGRPRRAPRHVPRAQVAPAELPLDARHLEATGHPAVERARPSHRDGARPCAGGRHDPGHEPIALLPVPARHVEVEVRGIAGLGAPAELDVGLRRCGVASRHVDARALVGVAQFGHERQATERRIAVERPACGRRRRGEVDELAPLHALAFGGAPRPSRRRRCASRNDPTGSPAGADHRPGRRPACRSGRRCARSARRRRPCSARRGADGRESARRTARSGS